MKKFQSVISFKYQRDKTSHECSNWNSCVPQMYINIRCETRCAGRETFSCLHAIVIAVAQRAQVVKWGDLCILYIRVNIIIWWTFCHISTVKFYGRLAEFYGRLRLIRSVLNASKFSELKLIEIVNLWVYYTIPFGFSLFRHFWSITFHCLKLFCLAKDHWLPVELRLVKVTKFNSVFQV